ncbi:hypothetical protein PHYC_02477 [Phycisphaerales bacterium]|nr:hypothetical protein PHYC_02477 [Phycisphaerales bacterium]
MRKNDRLLQSALAAGLLGALASGALAFPENVGGSPIPKPSDIDGGAGLGRTNYQGASTTNPPYQNQAQNPGTTGGTHSYNAATSTISLDNDPVATNFKVVWMHLIFLTGEGYGGDSPHNQPPRPNAWGSCAPGGSTTGTTGTRWSWQNTQDNSGQYLHFWQVFILNPQPASETINISAIRNNLGTNANHPQPWAIETQTSCYPHGTNIPGTYIPAPGAAALGAIGLAAVSRRRDRARCER